MRITEGTPYPTTHQELLLRAALLDGEDAVSAWVAWSAQWKLEDYLDNGSFRLLPLLYRNLARLKVEDERMLMLKGIYRQSWCKNMKLFNDSKAILRLFHAHGIPILLLKGPSLTIQYYKDFGARPMSDIDALVPREKAEDVITLLQNYGWKPEFEEYVGYNLRYGRSMMFSNSEGFELDLHWYPFFESMTNGSDADFWQNAVTIDFFGFPARTLCPADNLLHTIIHGVKWNPEPPIRWVPDAMAIMGSEGQSFDWHRFTELVVKFKVVLKTREALNYLHGKFHAPVPEPVLKLLHNTPVARSEKRIYQFDKKNPETIPDSFTGKLNHLFVTYLRQSGKQTMVGEIAGFIRFLHYRTRGKQHLRILWYYLTRNYSRKRHIPNREPSSVKSQK
jgi:hypothetical protein